MVTYLHVDQCRQGCFTAIFIYAGRLNFMPTLVRRIHTRFILNSYAEYDCAVTGKTYKYFICI